MDYQNRKPAPSKKNFKADDAEVNHISLRDVSLKDRRKEAKKPLFLTRYE
jgi:hypothetical protein